MIGEILELVEEHKLAGIIATNTTIDHAGIPAQREQQGGLSGAAAGAFDGDRAVHCGADKAAGDRGRGIFDGPSAREKFDAGAALVQVYTGFIYEGPGIVKKICRDLVGR